MSDDTIFLEFLNDETPEAVDLDPRFYIEFDDGKGPKGDPGSGGGGGTGDHGDLTGLGDDDHPQYFNQTRGDARYYTKSQTDTQVSNASTQDRNRANHTGTQLASTISDFTESVQDAVASLLASGANITLNYDDAGNTLTVSATGGDAEAMRDAIGAALVGTNGVDVVVNDAGDTIVLSVSTITISQVSGLPEELESVVDGLGSKADNTHTHSSADYSGTWGLEHLPPGATFMINWVSPNWRYNNSNITDRPSARTDLRMIAVGGTTAPSFGITHDLWLEEVP